MALDDGGTEIVELARGESRKKGNRFHSVLPLCVRPNVTHKGRQECVVQCLKKH